MASNSVTPATYTSKYGTIDLLDRTNYATWNPQITCTLLAANALEIALGESLAPANIATQAGQEWVRKRDIALRLPYNSTVPEIQKSLEPLHNSKDVVAMWTHLATFDPSLDSIFCMQLMEEFALESFRASDTVETYSQRLLDYQNTLKSSEYPISEPRLVLKLCLGMPDASHWNLTRQIVLRDGCNFQQAVTQFLITEPQSLSAPGQAADYNSANFVESGAIGGSTSRGRGRGKTWRRGGENFWNSNEYRRLR